jgi:phosphoserine phosphatase RsbU/P
MGLGSEVSRLLWPSARGRRTRADELTEARALQQRLLPREAPRIDGFDIACAWLPANAVSGDYFDVFALDGSQMAFCIADVAGKGMAAALLMQELQRKVRHFAPEAASPAELCTLVNRALSGTIDPERYITLFYAILDPGERRLRYESAGHCLPLLVRGDGSIEFPASFSGVVGIFSHWLYQNQEIQLRSGDCLLMITDGVIEAENRRHDEFGYQRLISLVQDSRGQTAASLSRQILDAVRQHSSGKLRDDASLIVLRVD